jgi:hypothetical protein
MKRPNKRTAGKNSRRRGLKRGVRELGVRALFAIPSFLMVLKNYEKLIGQVLNYFLGFFNQAFVTFMNFLSALDSTAIFKIGNV